MTRAHRSTWWSGGVHGDVTTSESAIWYTEVLLSYSQVTYSSAAIRCPRKRSLLRLHEGVDYGDFCEIGWVIVNLNVSGTSFNLIHSLPTEPSAWPPILFPRDTKIKNICWSMERSVAFVSILTMFESCGASTCTHAEVRSLLSVVPSNPRALIAGHDSPPLITDRRALTAPVSSPGYRLTFGEDVATSPSSTCIHWQ